MGHKPPLANCGREGTALAVCVTSIPTVSHIISVSPAERLLLHLTDEKTETQRFPDLPKATQVSS